ncbi:unnamed protein product, partial [Prorocentrum cordatum]
NDPYLTRTVGRGRGWPPVGAARPAARRSPLRVAGGRAGPGAGVGGERLLRRIDCEARQWRTSPPQGPVPAAGREAVPPEALRALARSAEERSLQLVEREARERRAALRQLEELVAQLGAHCVATAERQDQSHGQLLALVEESWRPAACARRRKARAAPAGRCGGGRAAPARQLPGARGRRARAAPGAAQAG